MKKVLFNLLLTIIFLISARSVFAAGFGLYPDTSGPDPQLDIRPYCSCGEDAGKQSSGDVAPTLLCGPNTMSISKPELLYSVSDLVGEWRWTCTCSSLVLNPGDKADPIVLKCASRIKPECSSLNDTKYSSKKEFTDKVDELLSNGLKSGCKFSRSLGGNLNKDSNFFSWSCVINNEVVFCSIYFDENLEPACGEFNGKELNYDGNGEKYDVYRDIDKLCSPGKPVILNNEEKGVVSWKCEINGKFSEVCSFKIASYKPKCGSLNGKVYSKQDWINLKTWTKDFSNASACSSGSSSSAIKTETSITWSCTLGGMSVNCSANVEKINGKCDPRINNQYFYWMPVAPFCLSGKYEGMYNKGGNWVWYCRGEFGGSDDYCMAYKKKIDNNAPIELINDNQKNEKLYNDKMAFVIADEAEDPNSWVNILSMVPVSTWTESNSEQGKIEIKKYPALVYWKKNFKDHYRYDPDSLIHFLQQYEADSVYFVNYQEKDDNNIPEDIEMANLLSAKPDHGAGIKNITNITINPSNYFSFWSNYDTVVISEYNYGSALLASTYASLINAPLVIEQTILDDEEYYRGKKLICIGNTYKTCDKNLKTEKDVQNSYRDLVKIIDGDYVDKIIATNPQDLNFKITVADSNYKTLRSEKTGHVIDSVFGRQSLSSPFLAAAKHELIVLASYQPIPESDCLKGNMGDCFGLANKIYLITSDPDNHFQSLPVEFGGNQAEFFRYMDDGVMKEYPLFNEESSVVTIKNGYAYILFKGNLLKTKLNTGETWLLRKNVVEVRSLGGSLLLSVKDRTDGIDKYSIVSIDIDNGKSTFLYSSQDKIMKMYLDDKYLAWNEYPPIKSGSTKYIIKIKDLNTGNIFISKMFYVSSGNGHILNIKDNVLYTNTETYDFVNKVKIGGPVFSATDDLIVYPHKEGIAFQRLDDHKEFVMTATKYRLVPIIYGDNIVYFDIENDKQYIKIFNTIENTFVQIFEIEAQSGELPIEMNMNNDNVYLFFQKHIFVCDVKNGSVDKIVLSPEDKLSSVYNRGAVFAWKIIKNKIYDGALTVVADPYSIPYIFAQFETLVLVDGYLPTWTSKSLKRSADIGLYARLLNSSGRLVGYTITDVSGLTARSIFYDDIINEGDQHKVSLYGSKASNSSQPKNYLDRACPIFDKDKEFSLDSCIFDERDNYIGRFPDCGLKIRCDFNQEFKRACDNYEEGTYCSGSRNCNTVSCPSNLGTVYDILTNYNNGKYVPGNPKNRDEVYTDKIIEVFGTDIESWAITWNLQKYEAEGWSDAQHIFYADHASPQSLNIDAVYVPELNNAFVDGNGCSSAEINPDAWGNTKADSIALRSLRQGATSFIGNVDVGVMANKGDELNPNLGRYINYSYYEKQSIGKSFRRGSLIKNTRMPQVLLGDPTIIFRGKVDNALYPF